MGDNDQAAKQRRRSDFVAYAALIIVGTGLALAISISYINTLDKLADKLTAYAVLVAMFTMLLVIGQLALGFKQTDLMRRQDDVLLRREILSADTGSDYVRYEYECTVGETQNSFACAPVLIRVRNNGTKSAMGWYLNIYVAEPADRRISGSVGQAQWAQGTLTYIGPTQYRVWTHSGTDPLFPNQGIGLIFNLYAEPGPKEIKLLWQAYGQSPRTGVDSSS
jgi:hypothetical protein